MKLDTIVVPLDGSRLAEAALDRALEIADKERTRLILLRAAVAHAFPGGDTIEAQVRAVREAEEYLEGIAARAGEAGMRNVTKSVWYGPPAWAIVEAAQFMRAGLIVMSTHGRSGLGRLVLGSVAESVLRGTKIPILLVRSPEAPVERLKADGATTLEATHV